MKNWSVDTKKLAKNPQQYNLWRLSQLINHGLDNEILKKDEVVKNWDKLKPLLDPKRARMLEYLIWKKTYSLKAKNQFWGLLPKARI